MPLLTPLQSRMIRAKPIRSIVEKKRPSAATFRKPYFLCKSRTSSFQYQPPSQSPGFSRQPQSHFSVEGLARSSGVELTPCEIRLLRNRLLNNDLPSQRTNGLAPVEALERFRAAGQEALEKQWAREFCLSAVEQPTSPTDRLGQRMLTFLDFGGKALFAVVGTQVAGEADMNVVGATLVGCISCLGGGTLNNWLYGTSPLLAQPGVNWVRNPSIFFLAVAASVFTFYAWPVYCENQAKRELVDVFGKDNLEPDGSVGKQAFVDACVWNDAFKRRVANATDASLDPETVDPEALFDMVDTDGSGYLEIDEMQTLIRHRFNGSSTIYMLDTVALSALAVTAVHLAITRGLHPLVAATSGITTCFGGIMRDVLCGRHMALGGQSYALATGAGSTVYIILRQLSLQGLPIPLVARILLSAGTTISVRMWEFIREEPLLRPMHYHEDDHVVTDQGEIEFYSDRLTTATATTKEKTTSPWASTSIFYTNSSRQ